MDEEVLLSKSNWWKAACINAALRGVNFTAPTALYIALYKSAPTDADTGQELSGGGYARQLVTFSAPVLADRRATVQNDTIISFPEFTADAGMITHIAIRTAATGGNMLYHGSVKNPRTAQIGDIIRFGLGRLKVDEG